MKVRTLLFAALLATGLTAGAMAALPPVRPFAPPSAAALGLGGAQASQWEALRQETAELRDTARRTLHDRIQRLESLLDEPAPDLRGFSREADQQIDAYLAAARRLHERRLAFYESLDPAAQAALRGALKARLQRAERLRNAFATLLHDDL